MPMSALERDTIAKVCAVSKTLLQDLHARLQGINEIYNAVGGVSSTLTQAELDEELALSGLTKAQLDDAVYAMSTAILQGITAGYSAIAQTAARNL